MMTNPNSANGAPVLVAHRGDTSRYPENTLPACHAALQAGACFIEIDIQLTADGIPVLFHDQQLLRTTGQDGLITTLDSKDLQSLDANQGHDHNNEDRATTAIPVPTLAEFIALLQQWPQAQAFIEIKEESLATFGHQYVLQQILAVLSPLQQRCIPISYDAEILKLVRQQGAWRIGWVARHYDSEHQQQARLLAPEYLICNHQKTGHEPLWSGPWQWLLYEVTDPALALQLYRRGAQMIETMAIGDLLQDTTLNTAVCHRQTQAPQTS